jgi:hypothetical protein
MNYKSIHDKLVRYIRETRIKDRILKRNKTDARLFSNEIYVEIHHIIPRSLGGVDDMANLIEVLPEEHIFFHMLRYKIYKKREDALAIRFMLNGYSAHSRRISVKKILTKKIRMGYCWIKTHAQDIRKNEGWHTEDGAKRISEARKGKMYVKDAVSGERMGMVSLDHPKVVSKEWVHHTKGRKQSDKEVNNKRIVSIGFNNPNHSGLSDEYFREKGIEIYNEFGFIFSWKQMICLSNERGFKWIKTCKSRFNGLGEKGYYAELEKQLGVKYDRWHSRREINKNNN